MKTTRRDKELFESQHYNRKLSRPMTFPFSRPLSDPLNGGGVDPDASAYLALLSGDGVSVSGPQAAAINDFFVTGKDEGWYSDLKRIYLPIWGAAGPNARCLVSSTSGTFAGSMTHGAGFVTGDGSSSYFDVGSTPSTLGIATGDCFIMRGIHASPVTSSVAQTASCGVAASSATASLAMLNGATGHVLAGTTYFRQPSTSGGPIITGQGADYRGIYIGSSTATDSRFLLRRRSGGTTVVSSTVSDTQSIYNGNPYFLSRNVSGSADYHTTQSEFAWALGTGMTQAQAGDFTAALETMWETCNGLTLF
jgi:hypothetical protein